MLSAKKEAEYVGSGVEQETKANQVWFDGFEFYQFFETSRPV